MQKTEWIKCKNNEIKHDQVPIKKQQKNNYRLSVFVIIWRENLRCGEKIQTYSHTLVEVSKFKIFKRRLKALLQDKTQETLMHRAQTCTHLTCMQVSWLTHLFSFQQLSQEIHLVLLVSLSARGFTVSLWGTVNAAPLSRNPAIPRTQPCRRKIQKKNKKGPV